MYSRKKNIIAARVAEPSTHAGLAMLAQVAGAFFPQYAAIAQAATVLFGTIAVALPEKGGQS